VARRGDLSLAADDIEIVAGHRERFAQAAHSCVGARGLGGDGDLEVVAGGGHSV
jgi:hypothetical protein